MHAIRAVVRHIAGRFSPEAIILFGSYAYGKPTPWSDVDLLVVMETPKGEYYHRHTFEAEIKKIRLK